MSVSIRRRIGIDPAAYRYRSGGVSGSIRRRIGLDPAACRYRSGGDLVLGRVRVL
jgi:hypothetical protein